MIKLICEDTDTGFRVSGKVEGDAFTIAKQLDACITEIQRQAPEVIDILVYMRENLNRPLAEKEP